MLSLFHYQFIVRGMEAGIAVAIVAPLIGLFLVLRRYSLIADTLAHVSLAGVALGLLFRINALLTAIIAAVVSSLAIERLRLSKKVYGESALAIFLSGGLALAVVIISLAKGFNVDLFSYLFGSILTVRATDVIVITIIAVFVLAATLVMYKELVYISFDEESAQVAGLPTRLINTALIGLAALTVAMAIPIVGVLLISALIVIPVVTALQLRLSFKRTIIVAEVISVLSVVAGIIVSFYLNLSTGGTIVLLSLLVFGVVALLTRKG